MSGVKISALPLISPSLLTDFFPIDQAGNTGRETLQSVYDLFSATSGFVGGVLDMANGGTGSALTADNGGIVYSGSSGLSILSHTTTANQLLLSGSSAPPVWSTATFPPTTTINQILYSSNTNVISGLVTSNNSVLNTTSGGVPQLTQTLPTAVQANITQLGTITSIGSPLGVSFGGTGNNTFTPYSVICAGTTATGSFSNVSGVGTSGQVLTSNGASTLPSWTTIPTITPSALTSANDTNVTLTLGGSPSIALINAASITAGWAGQLSLARGGTNSSLVASNGGVFYSTATGGAILAGTATANQILLSGTSSAPSWSTATYPSTTTINQILYSSASNVISGISSNNNGLVVTSNTGVPSILAGPGFTGRILQSNASAAPSFSTTAYPSAPGTAGQILRSNGTDLLYTTSAYANTYLANNILFSSGNNNVIGLASANNGVLVTGATGTPSILTGSGTTGRILQSNAAAAPSFSTATYPSVGGSFVGQILRTDGTNVLYSTAIFADTYTASGLLYSSGSNNVQSLATSNNGTLITSGAGVPSISTVLPAAVQGNITQLGTIVAGVWNGNNIAVANGGTGLSTLTAHGVLIGEGTSNITPIVLGAGQVLVGTTSSDPIANTLTASTRISINSISGSIVISGNLRKNDMQGIPLTFLTTTTVQLGTGMARDSTDTFDINLNTTPTINFATTGANGLDTGAIAANNWYAIHVIADSNNVNPTAGLASLSAASPTLPAGYNKFRRVGWVRTQSGAALIIGFIQTPFGVYRNYNWNDNNTFVTFLTAGSTAAAFTTVSLASVMPSTANLAIIQLAWLPNLQGNTFYFRPTGSAVTLANAIDRLGRGNGTGNAWRDKTSIVTNTSQQIDYATDQATDSLTLVLYSYQDSV